MHSNINTDVSQPVWSSSAHLCDAVDICGDAGPLQPVDAAELAGFHGGDAVHVVRRRLASTLCKNVMLTLRVPNNYQAYQNTHVGQ